MNKKYVAFFTEKGLSVESNKAYGNVCGYETNVTFNALDSVSPVLIYISCYTTDEQKRAIETEIRNAAVKFCRTAFSPYGLTVGLNGMTMASLLKRLPELFDLFYGILERNGALKSEFCPVCGNELNAETSKTCTLDGGVKVTLDADCVNNINAVITAENKEFTQTPNHYLRGFAGAVIGGLAGGLVAAALYAVGFISSISAFISIMLGAFLYGKFGGKQNKIMVVIVSVTTLLFMILSVFVIYLVATAIAVKETGVLMGTFEAFVYLMRNDAEIARAFWLDVILSVVFTAIGIGYQIFILLKKVKRPKELQ